MKMVRKGLISIWALMVISMTTVYAGEPTDFTRYTANVKAVAEAMIISAPAGTGKSAAQQASVYVTRMMEKYFTKNGTQAKVALIADYASEIMSEVYQEHGIENDSSGLPLDRGSSIRQTIIDGVAKRAGREARTDTAARYEAVAKAVMAVVRDMEDHKFGLNLHPWQGPVNGGEAAYLKLVEMGVTPEKARQIVAGAAKKLGWNVRDIGLAAGGARAAGSKDADAIYDAAQQAALASGGNFQDALAAGDNGRYRHLGVKHGPVIPKHDQDLHKFIAAADLIVEKCIKGLKLKHPEMDKKFVESLLTLLGETVYFINGKSDKIDPDGHLEWLKAAQEACLAAWNKALEKNVQTNKQFADAVMAQGVHQFLHDFAMACADIATIESAVRGAGKHINQLFDLPETGKGAVDTLVMIMNDITDIPAATTSLTMDASRNKALFREKGFPDPMTLKTSASTLLQAKDDMAELYQLLKAKKISLKAARARWTNIGQAVVTVLGFYSDYLQNERLKQMKNLMDTAFQEDAHLADMFRMYHRVNVRYWLLHDTSARLSKAVTRLQEIYRKAGGVPPKVGCPQWLEDRVSLSIHRNDQRWETYGTPNVRFTRQGMKAVFQGEDVRWCTSRSAALASLVMKGALDLNINQEKMPVDGVAVTLTLAHQAKSRLPKEAPRSLGRRGGIIGTLETVAKEIEGAGPEAANQPPDEQLGSMVAIEIRPELDRDNIPPVVRLAVRLLAPVKHGSNVDDVTRRRLLAELQSIVAGLEYKTWELTREELKIILKTPAHFTRIVTSKQMGAGMWHADVPLTIRFQ